MIDYFERLLCTIEGSIRSLDMEQFEKLQKEIKETLQAGHKIIVSGLGKNVPICEKFVGTMQSLGMDANFLHTNSAVHGDLGCVHKDDLVIILTKSGETTESVYLADFICKKEANLWLMTFVGESTLAKKVEKTLVINMDHEGDMWDLVPNNSTTIYLIILQALAIRTAEELGITIETFKMNHPGGHIGQVLNR